jgi:membrane-bound ClpP family serine protease
MIFDATIKDLLLKKLVDLEREFKADVVFYLGDIESKALRLFRDLIEDLKAEIDEEPKDRLVIILNTSGGSAEIVEKMVDIIRHHYREVYFIVPDFAMSAGTIFCMSGDKIYMDYSSSLGPIDPQVWNGKRWVPALGYLDKVAELLAKAQAGTITDAEFLILQAQDLAELSRFEQAKELTITLLKKWLVEYKFKDWNVHGTTPALKGKPVTLEEKETRAKEIADDLGNNKKWHSHARMLSINILKSDIKLRLKIDDFSGNTTLQPLIRSYNDLITEFITRNGYEFFLHSRRYFT